MCGHASGRVFVDCCAWIIHNRVDMETNANFESLGIPNVGFSLTKIGDQFFFPCAPVFEFVGLSTNSTVVKYGYSCLNKSFSSVSIRTPFNKTIKSGKTFLSAEAFLSLVFGGATNYTRSQTFDSDRLVNLRKFFIARIFSGKRYLSQYCCSIDLLSGVTHIVV